MVGDPPKDFVKLSHELMLADKQEQSDKEFKIKKEEEARKKAAEKRQKEIEKAKKKAEKERLKKVEEMKKAAEKALFRLVLVYRELRDGDSWGWSLPKPERPSMNVTRRVQHHEPHGPSTRWLLGTFSL